MRRKINLRCIIWFLLMIPLLKTPYMNKVPIMDLGFNCMRMLSGGIILYLYLKRQRFSKIIIIQLVFQLVLLITTLINSGNVYNQCLTAISVISFYLIVELMIKDNCVNFLNVMLLCSEILVYINLITLFIFPYGMYRDWTYRNWFLGTDNQHIGTILVAIFIALIYIKFFEKRVRPTLLIIACIVSIWMRWSATAVGGLLVFGILYIVAIKNYNRLFNFLNYMIVIGGIFLFIILLRLQNYFQFFIEDVLGKDLTFTGRVYIWDAGIMWIKRSWLYGYGVESYALHAQKTLYPSMHNTFLEYMYQGGIILIFVFFVLNFVIGKKLMENPSNIYTRIVSATIFTFYFMMQFEVYSSIYIEMVIVLAFFIKELIRQSENSEWIRIKNRNKRSRQIKKIFHRVVKCKGEKG